MKKKILIALAIGLYAFHLSAQTPTTSATTPHRVVIQLTSNDTLVWKGLMNNIKNLKNGWGDSVTIEVVAHGPGIEFLVSGKTTQQDKIAYFKSKGVVFLGCENTLIERKISKETIIPEAGFVKMGIGEVILKQEQGWSYIKIGF
ncbi:MAG: DsrE family protein [Chitinophagaceae bacterium]|nr:DsrE family protein [Chitinophagaceae bacterium]